MQMTETNKQQQQQLQQFNCHHRNNHRRRITVDRHSNSAMSTITTTHTANSATAQTPLAAINQHRHQQNQQQLQQPHKKIYSSVDFINNHHHHQTTTTTTTTAASLNRHLNHLTHHCLAQTLASTSLSTNMTQSRHTPTRRRAATTTSPSYSFIFMIICSILICTQNCCEAKPINQYQVKFRRLPPKSFQAALGSSVTVECEAASSPPATIHWLKNGKRITQDDFEDNRLDSEVATLTGQDLPVDDVHRMALSATRSRLFIDCVDDQGEATYTCVAENAYSRISSQTKLNLIKPVSSVNELALGNDEFDPAAAAAETEANEKELAVLPRCLSQRGTRTTSTSEPLRIHMWTHNIVEIMKNNIVLYCRSNLRRSSGSSDSATVLSQIIDGKREINNYNSNKKPSLTWTLPDDKLVGPEHKDKYEVLETGDLLIKDLSWEDMGSFVCTVSDEQSSDSISTFVYPAANKATKQSS